MTAAIETKTTPSLASLFNGRSMAWKFGRDALASVVAYGIPVSQRVAEQFSTYTSADVVPMLGVFSLFAGGTAVIATMGRYAGGGLGMACDAAFNAARGQPALKTAYGRKTLAAIGGVAAAIPVYTSFMLATGLVDLNVTGTPPQQTVAQASALTHAPVSPLAVRR